MEKIFKTAFTLIELLVVIAIIGILSGLIVVTMSGVTSKANIAKSQVFSNSLRNALMLNLVSEWKFDGTGVADGGNVTTAYTQDTWGSGGTGTINGSPKVYSGSNCVYGSCLRFLGPTDYVSISNFNFGTTNDFTISLWFNKENTIRGDPLFFGSSPNNIDIDLNDSGYGVWVFWAGGGTPSVRTTRSYADQNWHNLVFTRSGTTFSLYVDGTYINQTVDSSVMTLSGQTLGIINSNYVGKIDEVRIYNAAVPSSQIEEQYYSGLNSLLSSGAIGFSEYQSRIDSLAGF
jgi:prepilin-type N-terminal cleavage/methylation domain-containing protein